MLSKVHKSNKKRVLIVSYSGARAPNFALHTIKSLMDLVKFYTGLYGLKSDVHDFTKLTDDPPLNDLFYGSYDCASLGKDKGKKDTNVNECFLQSIRKACSVLQLPWPVCPRNIAESESCSISKPSASLVSSVSSMEGGVNFDIEGPSATDAPSSNKVSE